MNPIKTILVFGASGSGTTTLARAIAQQFGFHHIDIDDIFWERTDPPFTTPRPVEIRLALMNEILVSHDKNVISGAFTNWGNQFKPHIDLFIYMHLPVQIRLERIQKREEHRFGSRVRPGGDMYQQHLDFLEWVKTYETGDESIRSMRQHHAWLQEVSAPILRITEPQSIEALVALVKTQF